jgi:hypothetical protein
MHLSHPYGYHPIHVFLQVQLDKAECIIVGMLLTFAETINTKHTPPLVYG